SDIARGPGQMAFVSGGAQNPPSFTTQPASSTLVGYGQALALSSLVSGSLPITYQWQATNSSSGGWTNVAGQNANSLQFSAVNFGVAGLYRLLATNTLGSVTSRVAAVTVGAGFSELFNTGFDTNGVYEPT